MSLPHLKTPAPRPSAVHTGNDPAGGARMGTEASVAAAFGAPEPEMGKRAFMRMVSHELRTPLNSIIGFSEVLTHELYGPIGAPQYLEYAGIIRDSGRKLLSLFNDVLEIVRLENESDVLTPEIDAILPHLQDAVRRHRPKAEARGVRIDLAFDDEDLCALFDARGFANCLDHLLMNAIDFTPQGQAVDITVRATGHQVDIRLFNPGKAPAPEDVPRLMRPFEQGATEASRTREGAGLGWAIVRLSCKAMGGAFVVESDPDAGLTAILRLKADF
ncbi:HAMP domain-containing sensor histidine kinase [Asticcacaulis sp. BYS171W]|uniref:histidine kinase n=1 Tax=Asticcacaulis aquaticus TaxID=2984212 RepID=A0ABT5HVV7_9CAUL|nr:HAMP domain-containing sensor histidine kinase [Asticcacaulis aquaticus]MDC7683571.1 HAMP domain-containing sensor histidine kinase [Asticcacaulis aquaticus]